MTQIKIIKNIDINKMENDVNWWLKQNDSKIKVKSVEVSSVNSQPPAVKGLFITTITYEEASTVILHD
jgi:hypothetical protein